MPNDNDDTIKNPSRSSETTRVVYEPEYRRLNKEVVPYDTRKTINFDTASFDDLGNPVDVPDGAIIDNNDVVAMDYPSAFYKGDMNGDILVHSSGLDNKKLNASRNISVPPQSVKATSNIEDLSMVNIRQPIMKPEKKSTPNVGEYILMVRGKIVLTASKEIIEKRVSDLLYDQDKEFDEVSEKDLIILKRIPISIGIFIDE